MFLIIALFGCGGVSAQGHLENVIVETYYISDANDATDTSEIGGSLPAGSRTYRIFLDFDTACTLRAIYGDANHPISIASTAVFFNHLDRGKAYGHEVNNGALDEGTVALDSWLSFGAATNQKLGILKSEDPDGSIIGGSNNDGGSAAVPGGLLTNDDPGAGIPLTTADGLVPVGTGSAIPPNFNLIGEDPALVFGDSTLYAAFVSDSMRIGCSTPGMIGPSDENRILIAQLTTSGDLTFCINIEVETSDGSVIKYVSSDDVLLPGETANGLLCYPPMCGCTDPNYLEYDPNAGCDDGSCATAIVFGCLDTLACNYDPSANFAVAELCCYGPDDCNGLDVDIVCPDLSVDPLHDAAKWVVYPNPACESVQLDAPHPMSGQALVRMVDAMGRTVLERAWVPGNAGLSIDTRGLESGVYTLCAVVEGTLLTWPLMKR